MINRDEALQMAKAAGFLTTVSEGTKRHVDLVNLAYRRGLEDAVKACEKIAHKPSNVVLGVALECVKDIQALSK